MQKKGQLSLFLIVAIVLVLLTIIIFTIFSSQQRSQTTERLAIAQNEIFRGGDVETYTKSCLDLYANIATNLLAANGGHLDLPDPHHTNPDMAYYTYKQQNTSPTMTTIIDNFITYIENNIQDCLSQYNNPSISIFKQSITLKLFLEDEILLSYIINIRSVHENGRIEDREFEFVGKDFRLFYGYRIMHEITTGVLSSPSTLDLSFTYRARDDLLNSSLDSPESEPDVYIIKLTDTNDGNYVFQSVFDRTT
jgi:hypothetical protein